MRSLPLTFACALPLLEAIAYTPHWNRILTSLTRARSSASRSMTSLLPHDVLRLSVQVHYHRRYRCRKVLPITVREASLASFDRTMFSITCNTIHSPFPNFCRAGFIFGFLGMLYSPAHLADSFATTRHSFPAIFVTFFLKTNFPCD